MGCARSENDGQSAPLNAPIVKRRTACDGEFKSPCYKLYEYCCNLLKGVFENDSQFDIKLTDSQFFELKKYNALQIAGAFGVKPNQINDYSKSSYSNSEMQQLSFYVDTELFIIKQYEEEINFKMLPDEDTDDGYYYKFNEKVLFRTDSKTQMEYLKNGVNGTIIKPNEARRKLDMVRQ